MRLCGSRNEYVAPLRIERTRTDKLGEDSDMATSINASSCRVLGPVSVFTGKAAVRVSPGAAGSVARRRRISFESGHALELLGHAIEYLTDEYVHDGRDLSSHDPQLEAIQLLMALNRQIYFECPEKPSLWERCLNWLRLHGN